MFFAIRPGSHSLLPVALLTRSRSGVLPPERAWQDLGRTEEKLGTKDVRRTGEKPWKLTRNP